MPVVTNDSPQAIKDQLAVFARREFYDTSEHNKLFKWLFSRTSNAFDDRAFPIDEQVMLDFYHSGELLKATQLEF